MQVDSIQALADLVAIDTVSPLSEETALRVSNYLADFGLRRGPAASAYWLREPRDSKVWVYTHIDTKPPGERTRWHSDPFALSERESRLYGLGISDAKFQLLNALEVFASTPFGIVVDGAEESGGLDAASRLAAAEPAVLVVVDGSTDSDELYSGTMGQLDGTIQFDSGLAPAHPARAHRRGALEWLSQLDRFVEQRRLRLNVTGLTSEPRERSLTLEQAGLRFDLRYGPTELDAVAAFRSRYNPVLRQNYPPLFGRQERSGRPIATFSSPLALRLRDVDHVLVAPGARPENGNHQPNEWIDRSQIKRHGAVLRRVADALCGGGLS